MIPPFRESIVKNKTELSKPTAYVSSGDVFVYFLVPRASCLGTPILEAPASDRLK